ncbi:MAG: hypothetical protein QOF27_1374 [Gaiellaceae bacterium]|jgi:catechol 2,3-dioxygenase-like lactoylglutathione lyase family enzyme|nr:hypothetical protein [Gaiellaceae bacterium]
MFDHVTIRVSDQKASERFYDTVLATPGITEPRRGDHYAEWNDFSLGAAGPEKPVTRRLQIAFFAPNRAVVDEFWRAGTEAGYEGDGAPDPRPQYGESYYGAFLLDPDGNSVEAVHHDTSRQTGSIDHLWIRVADVAASRSFYNAVALHAGFRLETHTPDRAQFVGDGGTFSLVSGQPTEEAHLAFPVRENETVDAFHSALTSAGYPDNGAPGERLVYHEGYYGAFVLDPDGNNVELVNHNRGS